MSSDAPFWGRKAAGRVAYLAQPFFSVCLLLAHVVPVSAAQAASLQPVSYSSSLDRPTSPSLSRQFMQSIDRDAVLKDDFTTDLTLLRDFAVRFNMPVEPLLAFHLSADRGVKNLQLVGTRDEKVWQVRLEGKLMSLERLGNFVPAGDPRLKDYEKSVVGARVVLAYESKDSKEVVAIVQSNRSLYSVRRFGRAFDISPIGLSEN